jgi:tRNA threonylcarbamoyladenosine biosynthesis protein TsaB
LLAIDTSSDRAGVALFNDHDMYLRQWPSVRAQTTQVLPMIRQLITAANLTVADLAAVAVATGPGTFTGLRIGMSLAKGFALGRSIPLIGVPTLEASALPWAMAGLSVIAILPAGRGRLVWQWFGQENQPQALQSIPVNTTPPELIEAVESVQFDAVVGELTKTLGDQLRRVSVPVIVGAESPPRIASVAALAYERLSRGIWGDPASLQPTYVHGLRAAKLTISDPMP